MALKMIQTIDELMKNNAALPLKSSNKENFFLSFFCLELFEMLRVIAFSAIFGV